MRWRIARPRSRCASPSSGAWVTRSVRKSTRAWVGGVVAIAIGDAVGGAEGALDAGGAAEGSAAGDVAPEGAVDGGAVATVPPQAATTTATHSRAAGLTRCGSVHGC